MSRLLGSVTTLLIVWSGTFSTVLPDFEYSWHFSANLESGVLLRKQGSRSFEQDLPNGLKRSGGSVFNKDARTWIPT